MNCSVCGAPLLFDRVVFRCSCGTYIHAYCGDKHILQAHRPVFEEGRVDLNGEFHLKNEPEAATPVLAPVAAAPRDREDEETLEGVALPPDEDVKLEEEDEEGDDEADEALEPDEADLLNQEKADGDSAAER